MGETLTETEFDPSSRIDYTPNPPNSPISADFMKTSGSQIFDAQDSMFGMIPVQQVLLHLLRSVLFMVDSYDMKDAEASEDIYALCPGGIGTSLFPCESTNNDGSGKRENRPNFSSGTLINLFVALLTMSQHSVQHVLNTVLGARGR